MSTKSNRYVDNQGRVVLPSHIREALNLGPGCEVSIDLVGDAAIRIRAKEDRCCVCGTLEVLPPGATLKMVSPSE